MNRWLLIGSLGCLLIGTTGCLHHNTRGGCSDGSCATGGCSSGTCNGDCGGSCGDRVGVIGKLRGRAASGGNCGPGCNDGSCGNNSGVLGRIGNLCGLCGGAGCRNGCVAGPLGWQQGGHDYSSHLQPGLLGHQAASNLNSRPFTPGPPSAQTAYPYYTTRGPRDFLVDNPPTIGR